MNKIKQYNDILLPSLTEDQKGPLVQATNLVSAYSAEDFESFILEWLKYCQKKLTKDTIIGKVGGTGDDGIDIYENTNGAITYYQCKRYHSLLTLPQITDIIIKVLWHAFKNDIAAPNNLFIIAFKGINQKALSLLSREKTAELKLHLINSMTEALKRLNINEDNAVFKKYLTTISDYGFIKKIDLDEIVKDYCLSEYVSFRFVSSNPSRLQRILVSKGEYQDEPFYKQMKAIASRNKTRVLLEAKEQYYSALCLKETDRFLYGNNDEFNKLEKEVSSNIFPLTNKRFDDLFERYNAIIEKAMSTTANNVSLDYSLHIVCADDKAGICHKFVNEDKLSWEKEDDDE